MKHVDDEVSDPVLRARIALRVQAGQAFEARVARYLERELPNFLYGAEGASVDAGLLITKAPKDPVNPSSSSDRLSNALSTFHHRISSSPTATKGEGEEAEPLAPLEFKTIDTCLGKSARSGRNYFFRFECQPDQHACAAFIVGSLVDPALVAVIPHWQIERGLLNDKMKSVGGHTQYWSREVPYFGRHIEAFPPQWWPNVMPIRGFLPETLRSLETYLKGESEDW